MSCARLPRRICRGPTTASPIRAIRRPCCSAGSTASTASAAPPIRPITTAANMGSSLTELSREETTMQTVRTTIAKPRGIAALAVRAALVGACAIFVCACKTNNQVAAVPDVPTDYRLRHPITIGEADHTLEVFVGSSRGEINAAQRAEVAEFAHTWKREATGGVAVDLPVGTSNERAAAEAMRTIRSILTANGVPANGLLVRGYHPPERRLATIRISYPHIAAQAGPCGVWPEDIGPSWTRDH